MDVAKHMSSISNFSHDELKGKSRCTRDKKNDLFIQRDKPVIMLLKAHNCARCQLQLILFVSA
jgi:hypothetical protein